MRVLLVADTALARSGCAHLAHVLRRQGITVFEDPPLELDDLATSDLLLGLDAIGLFVKPWRLPPFLHRLRQAAALRGRAPVAVISGPTSPLVGDALVVDLLPRLEVDLLCLQGPLQSEELADLLRTCGRRAPAALELGLWMVGAQPPERPEDGAATTAGARRLVFLEQAGLPPAPGARERLLELLERLGRASPGWEVILQADPFRSDAAADGAGQPARSPAATAAAAPEPSLADLLLQRPGPSPLEFAPPEAWPQSLARAGVCATISSPLLWQVLARPCPLLLLGDYGIRSDMDGPLLFSSGLMGRLSRCGHLDELLDLPGANPGWLQELGWTLRTDAGPLVQWLLDRGVSR
jgi:hypothetical protein